MRLTLLNQFYPPDISPTAHLCQSLAEHRATLGDVVTMVTSRSGYTGRIEADDSETGAHVHRIWSTQLGSRSRLSRFIDWLTFYIGAWVHMFRMPPQDVIISLTTPPYLAFAAILHRLINPQVKIILWNMDCYPEAIERTGMLSPRSLLARFLRRLNRILFARLDHVVCLDEAMAKLLQQYKPRIYPLPFKIIPNWERLELFDTVSAKQEPKQSEHPFTILYLGNAGYGHEFQTLVDAAVALANEPVLFRFIGGGAKRAWLEEQKRNLKLNNLQFESYVAKDKTPELMRSADAALITLEDPMLGVMSPSKLHANLAMGLPVIYIGPEGGNVDHAIEQFGCGISVRVGDSQAVVGFIRDLMTDPQRHLELRRRARTAFEQAYCDKVTLPKFDRLLAEVAYDSPSHG